MKRWCYCIAATLLLSVSNWPLLMMMMMMMVTELYPHWWSSLFSFSLFVHSLLITQISVSEQ